MPASNYYASAYWTTSYFGQTLGVPTPPGPTDRRCFVQLIALFRPIVGPIQFADQPPPEYSPALAWMVPGKWSEAPDDDGDVRIRTVGFSLVLAEGEPGLDGTPALARLLDRATQCADALDNFPPSFCLSSLSRITDAIVPAGGSKGLPVPAPSYPTQVVVCHGQFAYEVRAGQRL